MTSFESPSSAVSSQSLAVLHQTSSYLSSNVNGKENCIPNLSAHRAQYAASSPQGSTDTRLPASASTLSIETTTLAPAHIASIQPLISRISAASTAQTRSYNDNDTVSNRFQLNECTQYPPCHCCLKLKSAVSFLQEQNAKLTAQFNILSQRITKSSDRNSSKTFRIEEPFSDRKLMFVKASLFTTGSALNWDTCNQIVLEFEANLPKHEISVDTMNEIKERHDCQSAPELVKRAVLEFFSLHDLHGRNFYGRVFSSTAESKQALDYVRMNQIQKIVFEVFPQQSSKSKNDVWKKCALAINCELRYLFNVKLPKCKSWLNVGLW